MWHTSNITTMVIISITFTENREAACGGTLARVEFRISNLLAVKKKIKHLIL
jgi:hypothetical protein